MKRSTPLFDRRLLQKRIQRADAHFGEVDFFIKHMSTLLADRLADVTHRFASPCLLGSHHGVTESMLNLPHLRVIDLHDEEILPLEPGSIDLFLSAWGLHWTNDLPLLFAQIRHALKADGCFIAQMPGPKTLQELRSSFAKAAAEYDLPLHNHIAPFTEVRDAGNLLQQSGFALPVIDSDTLTITYDNPQKLLKELRMMGETNMLANQTRTVLPKAYFARTLEIYARDYAMEDGRVPATVEIISFTAWSPDASQPKPAERGSGKVSFLDALK